MLISYRAALRIGYTSNYEKKLGESVCLSVRAAGHAKGEVSACGSGLSLVSANGTGAAARPPRSVRPAACVAPLSG